MSHKRNHHKCECECESTDSSTCSRDCGCEPVKCCKGERGPRGHRGHKGAKGDKGNNGATGPTGATGAAGSSAIRINSRNMWSTVTSEFGPMAIPVVPLAPGLVCTSLWGWATLPPVAATVGRCISTNIDFPADDSGLYTIDIDLHYVVTYPLPANVNAFFVGFLMKLIVINDRQCFDPSTLSSSPPVESIPPFRIISSTGCTGGYVHLCAEFSTVVAVGTCPTLWISWERDFSGVIVNQPVQPEAYIISATIRATPAPI